MSATEIKLYASWMPYGMKKESVLTSPFPSFLWQSQQSCEPESNVLPQHLKFKQYLYPLAIRHKLFVDDSGE